MKKKKKKKTLTDRLRESPINYFSDLFVVAMVVGWMAVLLVMVIVAVYVTIAQENIYMWSDIANLVAIPLTCGGAIWMIKNSVQHAIANRNGTQVQEDFPKVNAVGEDDGFEEEMVFSSHSKNEELG